MSTPRRIQRGAASGSTADHASDWSDVPRLEPLFPITAFTPSSVCPHKTRISRGSNLVCMVCHQSGADHRRLPGLRVGSKMREDWTDATPTVYAPPPDSSGSSRPTRKQRRAAAADGGKRGGGAAS